LTLSIFRYKANVFFLRVDNFTFTILDSMSQIVTILIQCKTEILCCTSILSLHNVTL